MILENGKYEFIFQDSPFVFEIRRNGIFWRDLTGDKAVLALYQKAKSLEDTLVKQAVSFTKHATELQAKLDEMTKLQANLYARFKHLEERGTKRRWIQGDPILTEEDERESLYAPQFEH